jgi:hypothetical protein
MMQSWAVERMAQERRRDLFELSRARQISTLDDSAVAAAIIQPAVTTHRSATGRPIAGGRTVRRHLGTHVGDLLIRAGTRLGGANMRTS